MNWKEFLKNEQEQQYYKNIIEFVQQDAKQHTICPPSQSIFNAFKYCSFENVKCVILGQDPYHGSGQAHGLSFSVNKGIPIPPSLKNIYRELKFDLGIEPSSHGCLIDWAKQGVLLLNATLTVREHQPNSHKDIGWHTFTDKVISLVNEKETPVVFVLWGAFANQKKSLLSNSKHLILSAPHPSPFSAHSGFFGSKPFSKVNEFLANNNMQPINWSLDSNE
jgi:uracil-DNA glycosylase